MRTTTAIINPTTNYRYQVCALSTVVANAVVPRSLNIVELGDTVTNDKETDTIQPRVCNTCTCVIKSSASLSFAYICRKRSDQTQHTERHGKKASYETENTLNLSSFNPLGLGQINTTTSIIVVLYSFFSSSSCSIIVTHFQ